MAAQVKDESLTKEELNLTSPQQIYITKEYNFKYQRAGSFEQKSSMQSVFDAAGKGIKKHPATAAFSVAYTAATAVKITRENA